MELFDQVTLCLGTLGGKTIVLVAMTRALHVGWSRIWVKNGDFVAYCHHIGTYPGHPRLLQTCEMEFYKNSKVFNYCQQEFHLRRCSSSRSASRVTAIVIMHPVVEKWSFVWSVTSYAARKKKILPRWSEMIKSKTSTTCKSALHSSQTEDKPE